MTDPIQAPTRRYDYLRDGAEIYRESFATIRHEAHLDDLPIDLHPVATRVIHAAGDINITSHLAAHPKVVQAARAALDEGRPVITDSFMLASGITRRRLPANNDVMCTLRDDAVPGLAARWDTTRSAAAVSLWVPYLDGAVVAIGNAPTALFHLLELLDDGAPRPAAIVGMPVGFVGSAESKVALVHHAMQIPWLVVHGRRGGSAMAAAAVNALAHPDEMA